MSEEVEKMCKKILKLSKRSTQTNKVMEELSELIRAVSRYVDNPKDKDNINNAFEEILDAIIMIKQFEIMLLEDLGDDEFEEYADKWEKIKLAELEELVEKLEAEQ